MYHSFGIYAIVNKVNGMAYVGQTSDCFGDRRDCHFASLRGGYGVNHLIQEDWDKYGGDNFEFVILKKCSDEDDLDKLEREFIERQRLSGCYNIGNGGAEAPNTGKHLSEETKKKIGIKNAVNGLGRKATDETKARMSESQAKRWRKSRRRTANRWMWRQRSTPRTPRTTTRRRASILCLNGSDHMQPRSTQTRFVGSGRCTTMALAASLILLDVLI